MSFQVTALPSYGGITLCFAMGAVVDSVPTTCHTPLSGQRSPVRAVVPMGTLVCIIFVIGFFYDWPSRRSAPLRRRMMVFQETSAPYGVISGKIFPDF